MAACLTLNSSEPITALTASNNVNGIDDGGGVGSVTMSAPNAITDIQDAFVRKLIDTLNDLPNVLWIVSQEAPPGGRSVSGAGEK